VLAEQPEADERGRTYAELILLKVRRMAVILLAELIDEAFSGQTDDRRQPSSPARGRRFFLGTTGGGAEGPLCDLFEWSGAPSYNLQYRNSP